MNVPRTHCVSHRSANISRRKAFEQEQQGTDPRAFLRCFDSSMRVTGYFGRYRGVQKPLRASLVRRNQVDQDDWMLTEEVLGNAGLPIVQIFE